MPAWPCPGKVASACVSPFAFERLGVGPQGPAKLYAGGDLDPRGRSTQFLELQAYRTCRRFYGGRRYNIETGNIEQPPEQAG
jgi:hypothetical protein